MIVLTTKEVARYRSQISEYEAALEALDAIEDCEGNLEDAAITLALKLGMEPSNSEIWLRDEAKRCRAIICQQEFREDLLNKNITRVVGYLLEQEICPPVLAAPAVIYAVETKIQKFCKPLD